MVAQNRPERTTVLSKSWNRSAEAARPTLNSELSTQHYHEGIELFNAGRFWDAHERWEECWRLVEEPDATFYKGIIQTAAALVHWQRGNPRGLERNWQKARLKLVTLPPMMHRIDLARLIGEMDTFVVHPHASFPQIELVP